ncbi:MAG: hypothetical protein WC783_03405 [Candidatus Paceibacterota bacterium]|jgi:hypothetical protein
MKYKVGDKIVYILFDESNLFQEIHCEVKEIHPSYEMELSCKPCYYLYADDRSWYGNIERIDNTSYKEDAPEKEKKDIFLNFIKDLLGTYNRKISFIKDELQRAYHYRTLIEMKDIEIGNK